jgi:hypothetical protein
MAERIDPLKKDYLNECAHLLMITFNAEPWNDNWTFDTVKKELVWTLQVPGFAGLGSLDDGIVAFATGYREPDDEREVFYLKTFCVRPDAQGKKGWPDLVFCTRCYESLSTDSSSSGLPVFSTFLSPQPRHPLLVDRPTFAPQSQSIAHTRRGSHSGDSPARAEPSPRLAGDPFASCTPRSAGSIWAGRSPCTPDARRPPAVAGGRDRRRPSSPGLMLRSFPDSPPLGCLCPQCLFSATSFFRRAFSFFRAP